MGLSPEQILCRGLALALMGLPLRRILNLQKKKRNPKINRMRRKCIQEYDSHMNPNVDQYA
jgi:hypothetical protein